MNGGTQIILNPTAYHGGVWRAWKAMQRKILRELAPAEVTVAESVEEVRQAVRDCAMMGRGKIVAVGGAETSHGVVNGLMGLAESHRKNIDVGFLSFIRQTEWSRTINFPRGMGRQLEVLRAGHTLPFDVGRAEFVDDNGQAATRFFLDGACIGLAPRIRRDLHSLQLRSPKSWLGLARKLGAYLPQRVPRVRLEGDTGLLFEGSCPLVLIMGGKYYPRLGEIASDADPGDGELDLVWREITSPMELLLQPVAWILPIKNYPGRMARARTGSMVASSQGALVIVEADGQYLGRLPATFTSEPRAMQVIVPHVGAKLKKPKFAPVHELAPGGLAGYHREARGAWRGRVVGEN